MNRLTRPIDKYHCRIKECPAEGWMYDLYNQFCHKDICKDCPFEEYINRLAELEDKEEIFEDDGK